MNPQDLIFIRKALALARKGTGQVSPNPLVGALLVREGKILGDGFYTYEAMTHAEVKAIHAAGPAAKGSTLYINLEPCSHYGRTPPCTDAIIRGGIKRVVACMKDPNPKVSGRGFRKLRAAGIQVDIGLYLETAERLNEIFACSVRKKKPFVLLKAGVTMDGKIATKTGQSQWITSPPARNYVQRLRWEYDAILVGANTILRDDPELALRIDKPKRRPLLKVILDARLRIPLSAKVLRARDQGQVIVYASKKGDPLTRRALAARGVIVQIAPTRRKFIDLVFVCKDLHRREVSSLLIEGGSQVNWSALHQKIVDKVLFIVAPKIIGGTRSISVVGGEGVASLASSLTVQDLNTFRLGPDLAIEGYL